MRHAAMLFIMLAAFSKVSGANASSHQWGGCGIDERGFYIQFKVYYYQVQETGSRLNYSKFSLVKNNVEYLLFETATQDQGKSSSAASYYCDIAAAEWPLYIYPNDSYGGSHGVYNPGRQYWGTGNVNDEQNGTWSNYNRRFRWSRVWCRCVDYAEAYVRVYIPSSLWGTEATPKWYCEWSDGRKETHSGSAVSIRTPLLYKESISYETGTEPGKIKFTVNLKNGYAYADNFHENQVVTCTAQDFSNATFTDSNAKDKTVSGTYTANIDDVSPGISIRFVTSGVSYSTTLSEYKNSTQYTKTASGTAKMDMTYVTGYYTQYAVTYPKNLVLEPKQLSRSVLVTWAKQEKYFKSGKFYVYRYNVQSGSQKEGKLLTPNGLASTVTSYEDKNANDNVLNYDTKYRYVVFFAPDTWTGISTPISNLSVQGDVTITRTFPVTLSIVENKTNIKLGIKSTQTSDANLTYTLYRKTGSGQYSNIGTASATSTSPGTLYFTDNNVQAATEYTYQARVTTMGTEFTSNTVTTSLGSKSSVLEMSASKGEMSDRVKLSWKTEQIGTGMTQYRVSRKLMNGEGDYYQIYSTESTNTLFYYDDVTALPGQYYIYKVEARYQNESKEWLVSNYLLDDGFCMAKGIVSGRITYGTGTAVPDAKVIMTPNNGDDGSSQFYSMRVSDYGGGISIPLTASLNKTLFDGDKPFSIEMWVRPDQGIRKTSTSQEKVISACLLTINGQYGIDAVTDPADSTRYRLMLNNPSGGIQYSDLYIYSTVFTHITLSNDGNGLWSIRTVDQDSIRTWSYNCPKAPSITNPQEILIGNPRGNQPDYNFTGYIDEVRIWSKCLTDKEILQNCGRVLSGSENGLKVYLPMDEGIQNPDNSDEFTYKVYDYSKTGGVVNSNHGTLRASTAVSKVVPTESQFSLHAYSDLQGSYTVSGIPFSGEGTSYYVRPTLGIHEFSPQYLTRYINGNSLTHNGVDFTDVSSFKVSGTILYENTLYPVEGCNIYVDGTLCAIDGEPVESDKDGKFTVSVPIGAHYITVKKSGHEFVNAGRYPADPNGVGKTANFEKEISNLMFYDKTLVNLTGRVVGGDVQGSKPYGFGLSANNLGTACIRLVPSSGETYPLNVDSNGEKNKITLACPSATDKIGSTAYRGAGDESATIVITTDSKTGEFSAMVPPLVYRVKSMGVVNDNSIELEADKIGLVDMSNPLVTYTDTLSTDGTTYDYNYALNKTYYSNPVFTVAQKGNDKGAFGIDQYELWEGETSVTVPVYTVESNVVDYKFGDRPAFISGDSYIFNMTGYEQYVNADDHNVDKVPLSGVVVTISNELSSSQKVLTDDANVEGQLLAAGSVVELEDNQLTLDSDGKASYMWTAGFPNISGDHTRGVTITYDIDGRVYSWDNAGFAGGFRGIILGSIPTGNNFVTSGPDHLAMILRDPPGTNSKATWTSGTVTSKSRSDGGCWSLSEQICFVTHFGVKSSIGAGLGVMVMSELEGVDDLTTGVHITSEGEDAKTQSTSLSISKTVSTKDTPEYVGAGGDVFIGTATNIILGEAKNVGIYRIPDSQDFTLDVKDVITAGQKFGTVFQYDQLYIENTLLPNLEALRNSMLTYYEKGSEPKANNTKSLIYISHLTPDDDLFGSDNYDRDVWGSKAVKTGTLDGESYMILPPSDWNGKTMLEDSVYWCNLQIKAWKRYLALNEEEKVKAFMGRSEYLEDNLSFDTGADVDFEYELEQSKGSTYEHTTGCNVVINNSLGFKVNGMGLTFEVETENGGAKHLQTEQQETQKTAFTYTLSEDGDDDALTVDVFNYGNYSRIFRTRGGQTCGPYEGEVTTKYYQPGTVIMEATQQIEVPDIEASPTTVSNVPAGSAANFNLILNNNSQIGEDVYYILMMIDESNPNGAILMIDGMPLTDGRIIKVPAGETVNKSLQLYQSNKSILEYENIGIVLASQCQYDPTSTWDQIADSCWISAYFVPSASAVSMELDNTVLNTRSVSDLNPDPVLKITVKGFDRNYFNQKAFRIQYRQPGDNAWTMLHEYLIDSLNVQSGEYQEYLDNVSQVTYPFNMASFNDGQYTFRVESACTYGLGQEVKVYSNEITMVKDMKRPQVLGNPKPLTGILTQGDEISLTFNEDINSDLLNSMTNFSVRAQLNEAAIANDVALRATGSQEASASTQADINLSGRDFAMDMWVNVSGQGTLVAHGNGQNKFRVGVDAQNQLTVSIGDKTYTSTKTIELDKWIYLALSYAWNGSSYILDALMANDASTVPLFLSQPVASYSGNGRLSALSGITASLHDLTLWDQAVPVSNLQARMHESKKPSTDGLIGYWRFDEGTGLTAADKSRNRNMVLSGSNCWYMNVDNKALVLDGSGYASLNISACAVPAANDYAVELWFNANSSQAGTATVFSVGSNLVLRITQNGLMELASGSYVLRLGSQKVLDDRWHHFALNVLRNGTATVYIDGQVVAQTSSQNIGYMQSDAMILGANRTFDPLKGYQWSDRFKGAVDDVRIWDASMNSSLLKGSMDRRLEGTEDGLVAYYPFEQLLYDSGSQPYTSQWLGDGTGMAPDATVPEQAQFTDGPAQAPAKNETGVGFTFVASQRTIVISLTENADLIEGTTVNLTVKNVQDMNGNSCEPIRWTAYVNCNRLVWNEDGIDLKLEQGTAGQFKATVVNNSAITEQWSIEGIPSWITASMTGGTLTALSQQSVTFTVSDALQLGTHDFTLMLSGNNGIGVPLAANVTVTGDEPDWSVDVAAFESNMTIFGQIWDNGTLSQNTGDMVAAFIGGECRGVAAPVYYPRYDAYFTQMMVYGNGTDAGKPVEFKIWNAAQGKVYPTVECRTTIDSQDKIDMKFASNGNYGTAQAPMAWNALDRIEEALILQKGWNWTSLYVDDPDDMSVSGMLNSISLDGNRIVGFNNFADCSNGTWSGNIGNLEVGRMYMVKSSALDTLTVSGKEVQSNLYPVTIQKNWNWIGLNASYAISLNQAFAGLEPANNDLVKSQNAFAVYDGYEWVGRLTSLAPGKGYMYSSQSGENKQFTYPAYQAVAGASKVLTRSDIVDVEPAFSVNDQVYHKYPGNMTIVARVMDNGWIKADAQAAVFVDGECRDASVAIRDGLLFLIVPGQKSETLNFEVVTGGIRYSLKQTLPFQENAQTGTPANPYLLKLGAVTGIDSIEGGKDASDSYNTTGVKVDNGYNGIIIRNGSKYLNE